MVRMDEYCSSVRDGTHDTPKPTSDGKYLVTSKAIHDNTVDFSSCYFISQKDFDKINARSKVDKWDVLMTMIGSVGRLLLVQNEPNYAIKNIALFKIGNEDKAKWLYFYLSNKPIQDYFEAVASGTSQHFIGLGHLRKLKIADFNENSKKIVSILSAYDNLIENNNKRIKILEQMAENLYKEWFVRFRFPGHENTPFENGIPKGWNHKRISDFYETSSGGTPSRERTDFYENGTVPWIKTGELQDSIIIETEEKITETAVKKSAAKIIPANSILMAMYGVNIGMLAYTSIIATCNQACCVFKDKKDISTKHYLFYFLKSIRNYLLTISFGAAQQNISQDLIKRIKILVPNDSILKKFESTIDPIYNHIIALNKQNQNLIKQRDLLLPRLMSGKLAV